MLYEWGIDRPAKYMKTFYTYKGEEDFHVYDVVLAEPNDVIVVEDLNITNISKTNRSINNCPNEILASLLSRCTIISSD